MTPEKIYDVIVVGGGPTGSTAARYAKLNGIDRVLVVEENASIGSPVQCAGLLSAAALLETDMEPDPSFVFNAVKGADVYPPSGKRLRIVGTEIKAYVVSRKMFDRQLALKAAAVGVEYLLKAQAVGLEDAVFDGGKFKVLKIRHEGVLKNLYAKIIIAADGVRSRTVGFAGLKPCEKVLSGIQFEANYKSNDPDFVEIFVGQEAPGFFAWSIPVTDTVSRIGLAVDPERIQKEKKDQNSANLSTNLSTNLSACDYLNHLLLNPVIEERIKPGFSDFVVGGIPIGPMKKTYAAGLMVAGDAAGHCKPVSGGGVYTGAVAAKIAAKVAAEAVEENDFTEKKMAEYEKRWKKELGRELEIGMRVHDYRMKLSDDDMDRILDELNDPEILELITQYGDMDHPSVLIQKLMLSKHSLKMAKLFGTFVKTLF